MSDPKDYGYTAVNIKEETRDNLRKFKAEHGITYDEAVQILLKNSGWGFDDE